MLQKSITVDVFAICYNEMGMLPFFINHYKSKFNANITIYDNESTDGSKELAENSGCNVISYNSNNQIRDDLYLDIKNHCWKKSKADWVIIVDCDELLDLNFPVDNCTMITTQGYDILGCPPSRLGVPNKLYSKSCMFRPSEIEAINYAPGCHTSKPIGNLIYSTEIAPLLHYKYISEQYVFSRHKMYQGRVSDFNKRYEFGIEYFDVKEQEIKDKFAELRQKAQIIP